MGELPFTKHIAHLSQFCIPPQVYVRPIWSAFRHRSLYSGIVNNFNVAHRSCHMPLRTPGTAAFCRNSESVGRRFAPHSRCSTLIVEGGNKALGGTNHLTVMRALGHGRGVSTTCCTVPMWNGSPHSRFGAFGALIRLHAPVGTWLLFLPCVFSLGLALPVSTSSKTSEFAKEANFLPATATLVAALIFHSDSRSSKEEANNISGYANGCSHEAAQGFWSGILEMGKALLQSCMCPGIGLQDLDNATDRTVSDHREKGREDSNLNCDWLQHTWCRAFSYIGLCGVGAFLMRSVGCIVNDMWDVSIDRKVSRTRNRPLASGAMTRSSAVAGLAFLLMPAVGILLQFNLFSVFLGLSSLGLVVVYPAMKRIFALPQLFLGLTFNWGALFGWAALLGPTAMPTFLRPTYSSDADVTVEQSCTRVDPQFEVATQDFRRLGEHLLGPQSEQQSAVSPPCNESASAKSLIEKLMTFITSFHEPSWSDVTMTPLYLYIGAALWTFTYDTLYAHQDTVDDRRIGVRSSALVLGQRGTRVFGTISTVFQGLMWLQAGRCVSAEWPYYLGTLCCCLWITRILWCTNLMCQASCKAAFVANQYIGATFAASIFASKAVEWSRSTDL